MNSTTYTFNTTAPLTNADMLLVAPSATTLLLSISGDQTDRPTFFVRKFNLHTFSVWRKPSYSMTTTEVLQMMSRQGLRPAELVEAVLVPRGFCHTNCTGSEEVYIIEDCRWGLKASSMASISPELGSKSQMILPETLDPEREWTGQIGFLVISAASGISSLTMKKCITCTRGTDEDFPWLSVSGMRGPALLGFMCHKDSNVFHVLAEGQFVSKTFIAEI